MCILGAKLAEISMRDGSGVDQWGSPLKPALLESDSTTMHSHYSINSSSSNGSSSSVVNDLHRSAFSAFEEPATSNSARLPDAAFKV
jgi:hypothetical protein